MQSDRMRAHCAPPAQATADDAAPSGPDGCACIAPSARASTGVRRTAWRKAPPSMPAIFYKPAGTRRTSAVLPLLLALDELAHGPRARLRELVGRLGLDRETACMVHALARKLAGDALRRDPRAIGHATPRGRPEVLAAWSAGVDEAVSACGRLMADGLAQAEVRAALAESFRRDRAPEAVCTPRSSLR